MRCRTLKKLMLISAGVFMSFGGCSSHEANRHGRSHEAVGTPSEHALVLPAFSGRTAALVAGIAPSGSDFGPFVGRRDARIGVTGFAPERLATGFERRINDRQYSNVGRPRNSYTDVTRSVTRIDR